MQVANFQTTIIESRAPGRIDLAGGTIDIWPIYLFHHRAVTVNAAINLYAKVKIITRNDKKIVIKSQDLNISLTASKLSSLIDTPELKLITKLIKFFKPEKGFEIITTSQIPHGSGLGGSSTMGIALCGALNCLTGNNRYYSGKDIIQITKDLEAQVIMSPPGDQDYYPAKFGGINALWLNVGGVKVEKLHLDTKRLNKRLVLCHTGKSRFSGTNNWHIVKGHIDGDKDIYFKLDKIKETSLKMREAIVNNNLDKVGKMLKVEWMNRKDLFNGVSNKRIEDLIAISMKNGAVSAKVCGAGGGGCILFFVKDGFREKVKEALKKGGGEVIDFSFVKRGLSIKVSKSRT